MQCGNIQPKQLITCSAIIDILRIFADTEIGGQYEIDFEAVCNYLDSMRFGVDYFDCNTTEEIYERFTKDIYNGLPVWRFLKLPEWTMKMVEKTFQNECDQTHMEMKRTYKCLSCKYLYVRNTSFGVLQECKYEKIKEKEEEEAYRRNNINSHREFHKFRPYRKGPFELKQECDNYEEGSITVEDTTSVNSF